MPLADLLRPEQRQWLRRLRRRIANREVMRRHRAANRDKRLCADVDLPLVGGDQKRAVRVTAGVSSPRPFPPVVQPSTSASARPRPGAALRSSCACASRPP